MSINLTRETYASFRLSKRFLTNSDNELPITSLDYDDSGQFLLATSINQSIQLFDAVKGKFLKSIQSKKYGCHLAKFTHNSQNCIYSSTKLEQDHTIRYLSLVDNSYIRYFRGHKQLVTSLEVSPTHDLVLSASMDNSVRLWDLRASNSQGFTPVKSPTALSFDPSGLVCAMGSRIPGPAGTQISVTLKDVRKFDSAHFLEIKLPPGFEYNKMEFSNDNKYILFSSVNGNHLIADAFSGDTITELQVNPVPVTNWPSTGTACFTPDGKFVLSGDFSGSVNLYDLTGQISQLTTPRNFLKSSKDVRPKMVNFNPKFAQFTTADNNVNMWIPEL